MTSVFDGIENNVGKGFLFLLIGFQDFVAMVNFSTSQLHDSVGRSTKWIFMDP